MGAHYEQQRRLFDGGRRRQIQQHSHPPPQHLFCPQPQQLRPHYGGPASEIWCERCGRAAREAKMCAAREPRRFNGIYGTCSERGHLSWHCLLRRDRICSDVPTLSSPPLINRSGRGGTGYDLPMLPPSYSGRSGGTGCDIPRSPPGYSGSNNDYGTNGGSQQQYGSGSHRYRAKPFVRHHSGGDGTAPSPPQQPAPRPFSSFGWEQRYNGGHSRQQPGPRPFSSFGWEQRYNGGNSTALWPQQQQGPHPFRSFGWEQRYACRNVPPVNGELSNSIS